MNFEFLGEGERVAAWIKGVGVEDQARQQIMNASRLPFVFKHIAVMPDCFWAVIDKLRR